MTKVSNKHLLIGKRLCEKQERNYNGDSFPTGSH